MHKGDTFTVENKFYENLKKIYVDVSQLKSANLFEALSYDFCVFVPEDDGKYIE